jgi:hypothetical protein
MRPPTESQQERAVALLEKKGMARHTEFVKAGIARRKAEIPLNRPDALTQDFASDPGKVQQWAAFVDLLEAKPGSLDKVVEDLAVFLMPHAEAARRIEGAGRAASRDGD